MNKLTFYLSFKSVVFCVCFLFHFSLRTQSQTKLEYPNKPAMWILTDITGFKIGERKYEKQNQYESRFNTQSDPDDYSALSMYLMNSNKFNTVRIVLGNDGAPASKSTPILDEFDKWFLPAYTHDVRYWNSKKGPGGFLSPSLLRSKITKSSTQGKAFNDSQDYADFNSLPQTVKELVLELQKSVYSKDYPLYVNVWGPLTEVAMAVAHLKSRKNAMALENLFVVSHWTSSFVAHQKPSRCITEEPFKTNFGVANCSEDCLACKYLHEEAKRTDSNFRFVDVGSIGQRGIVNGSIPFFQDGGFNGKNAQRFKNSDLGRLFITSNFTLGRPDGSDSATFYTILGTYGVSLSDFNNNGVLTAENEENAISIYKESASDLLIELANLCEKIPSRN